MRSGMNCEFLPGEKLTLYRALLKKLAAQHQNFWDKYIAFNDPAKRNGANISRVYISRDRSKIRGRAEEIVSGVWIEVSFGESTHDFFKQACSCVEACFVPCPEWMEKIPEAVKADWIRARRRPKPPANCTTIPGFSKVEMS
ncbi:MAG: hypothetical protein ACT4PZ_07260 [Panacagrimonas sp.]